MSIKTSATAPPAAAKTGDAETENDRFKRSFGSWFWASMIAATVVHFTIFQFWPTLTAADVSLITRESTVVELMPDIDIPPEPDVIPRPATPVVAIGDIEDDITIGRTTLAANPIDALPPPPIGAGPTDVSSNPVFQPMTVRPEITNRPEVEQALMREYPPILRDAGMGGTAVVWFFISEDGTVLETRVATSSGQAQLDEAALEVANVFRFTPALNRDQTVAVWIAVPIVFRTQ